MPNPDDRRSHETQHTKWEQAHTTSDERRNNGDWSSLTLSVSLSSAVSCCGAARQRKWEAKSQPGSPGSRPGRQGKPRPRPRFHAAKLRRAAHTAPRPSQQSPFSWPLPSPLRLQHTAQCDAGGGGSSGGRAIEAVPWISLPFLMYSPLSSSPLALSHNQPVLG